MNPVTVLQWLAERNVKNGVRREAAALMLRNDNAITEWPERPTPTTIAGYIVARLGIGRNRHHDLRTRLAAIRKAIHFYERWHNEQNETELLREYVEWHYAAMDLADPILGFGSARSLQYFLHAINERRESQEEEQWFLTGSSQSST